MRKPIIAGNWKMNTTAHQGAGLVIRLRDLLRGVDTVEAVVAPPFTSIHHLSHLVAGSPIQLAGQDIFWEREGAYTGEISPEMLVDIGCRYVIVGHSERREHFHETDSTVNKKVRAALQYGLKPIVCVGETLKEKEAGATLKKVSTQVRAALDKISGGALKDVTIAYEPIWAIGTGLSAGPEEAEEVHNAIRDLLYEAFSTESVKRIRIIYGGSVNPGNIDSLMAQPNIDGALVGGASLNADDFARIVKFQPA